MFGFIFTSMLHAAVAANSLPPPLLPPRSACLCLHHRSIGSPVRHIHGVWQHFHPLVYLWSSRLFLHPCMIAVLHQGCSSYLLRHPYQSCSRYPLLLPHQGRCLYRRLRPHQSCSWYRLLNILLVKVLWTLFLIKSVMHHRRWQFRDGRTVFDLPFNGTILLYK